MESSDLGAVWLTLKLATIVTVLLLIIGTPIAWWLARTRSAFKGMVGAIVALPLVLPPTVLGIGIGGTAEKAVLMAKESLMDHLDMYELQAKAASGAELSNVEKLRLELFEKVNALGIGAQGLGGLTTVLDVKIRMYPTHAASKPIAMIPNCAATRRDNQSRPNSACFRQSLGEPATTAPCGPRRRTGTHSRSCREQTLHSRDKARREFAY